MAREQQLMFRRRHAKLEALAQQSRDRADMADDQRPPMMQQRPRGRGRGRSVTPTPVDDFYEDEADPVPLSIIESSEAAGWWNPARGVFEDLPVEGYTWQPLERVPATAAAAAARGW